MPSHANADIIGALVRDARTAAGLTQTELARQRMGASRLWVAEFEKREPCAELGLALKTFHALALAVQIGRQAQSPKLTKAVGGQRAVASIAADHWRAAGQATVLPADLIIERLIELGERMPAAIQRVFEQTGGDGKTRHIMHTAGQVMARVRCCLTRL